MSNSKERVGPLIEGTMTTYLGDREFLHVTRQACPAFRDSMGERMSPVYGPEFFVSHHTFLGASYGITTKFPETQYGPATEFDNWIPQVLAMYTASPPESPHLSIVDPKDPTIHVFAGMLNRPRASGYAVELCSKTNPGRPLVSLPSFVGEILGDLKDLPSRIYRDGQGKLRSKRGPSVAGAYFGYLPLVSDILKLQRFSEHADKRAQELSNLSRKGGARVRKTLFEGKNEVVIPIGQNGADAIHTYFPDAKLTIKTRAKVWGVTHWLPSTDTFRFVNEEGQVRRQLISGILAGTSAYKDKVGYLRDAWELLPWSWFGDWFGNFGDYLDSYANTNIATFGDTYIMCEITTTRAFECSRGSVFLTSQTRERCKANPSLQLRIPFLSAQKMSILASIANNYGTHLSNRRSRAGGGGNPSAT